MKRKRKETGLAPREGWAAAAKQAHDDGEDKLMAADVFEDETMEDWIPYNRLDDNQDNKDNFRKLRLPCR